MITFNNNGLAEEFADSIKQAFVSLPEEDVNLFKLASNPDQDFEQSFFQLAYDKIQEKLFNLLPFLVGFEIVNKNPEGTKALGVFGFKSNSQTLFVPAFFINGSVKGLELLYSKNNEQFYPLSEDFAEMFLKNDATGLGTPSKEDRTTINGKMPSTDLRNLVRPPQIGKRAHTTLIDFVENSDNLVKEAFYTLFKDNDSFCESVLRFYPLDKVAKALVAVKEKEIEPPQAEVSVIKMGDDLSSLTEDEKLEVIKKGFLLLDKRHASKKSKVGLFKYDETFTNPTESGFYSYVNTRGQLRHALILLRPDMLEAKYHSSKAYIIDLKSGKYVRANPNKIFVRGQYKIESFSELMVDLGEVAEVSPSFDEAYMLINEALYSIEPFRVTANYKGEDGVRVIEVSPLCVDPTCHTSKAPFKLHLTKKKSDHIEHCGEHVYLPKGFKLLPIEPTTEEEFYPGTISNVTAALRSQAVFPFSVSSNGSDYFVSVAEFKKKYSDAASTKLGMVLDLGLDYAAADELVDSIHYTSSKQGQIKLAYTGENFFSLRDPVGYANQLGQTTYNPDDGGTYIETLPQDISYTDDPTQLGKIDMGEIGGQNTEEAINSANQLAQHGQKNIFDTQAIATLSKYVQPQQKTNAYMPEFISALDKLGRMLFLVFGETEKFEEMYGRGELPELIELLSNVFKNLGDLVIFLKRKSPELSINMSENEQQTQ